MSHNNSNIFQLFLKKRSSLNFETNPIKNSFQEVTGWKVLNHADDKERKLGSRMHFQIRPSDWASKKRPWAKKPKVP